MLNNKWKIELQNEMEKSYFKDLEDFIEKEYKEKTIYPPKDEIFNVYNLLDFDCVKVVILGQDPYHGKGQGHGLAFSVKDGVKVPPSLRNIYKELQREYDYSIPSTGNLLPWVKEGVFLLNTVLTVEEGKAHSHKNKGWEEFTDKTIELLSRKREKLVFILWGNAAIKKEKLIDGNKHLILKGVHPSPLSANRGFFGNNHFILCNEYLKKNGLKEINWEIKDKGRLF